MLGSIVNSFLAGMLHDIGVLLLAVNFPEKYKDVLTFSKNEKREIWDTEKDIFGITHSEVGAYLMGIWGMNSQVTEAIIFHHRPEDCECRDFIPLTAVYAGNIIDHQRSSKDKENNGYRFDPEYLSRFHFNISEKTSLWSENCVKIAEEVSYVE